MLKVKRILLPTVGGLVILFLGALAFWRGGQGADRADPDDARLVALGQEVYARHCAACHGDRLQGQPDWRVRKPDGRLPAPPHDETGHTWHHPDQHLFRLTRDGLEPPLALVGYESDMPAFADALGDEEIWAVLSYIKSTWPAKARAYQERADKAYRSQATEQ